MTGNMNALQGFIFFSIIISSSGKPDYEYDTYVVGHKRGAMDREDRIKKGESEGECLCPSNVNTTGTWLQHCGRELSPTSKCSPDAIYRCVNNRKIAINTGQNCAKSGEKCVQKMVKSNGEQCPGCSIHKFKTCIK